MSFHERQWASRFGQMGDEAEGVFETVTDRNHVRYGLNRPPLAVQNLPLRIRYTPDYLTSHGFVEVKGCGKDGKLKIKLENWNELHCWNNEFPVDLFIWDSHRKRHTTIPLVDLSKIVNDPEAGVQSDHFHDGKLYLAIPVDSIDAWTDVAP